MNLADLIKLKFPNIDLFGQVIIQDDGQGPYIKKWDDSLGPIPTQKDLDQWAIELEPVKFALDARENRRKEYPPIGDQLDAILKYFETVQNLTPDLQDIKTKWENVKTKYPLVKV